jgi:hypothetical protein
MSTAPVQYDVALLFAGEDRATERELAEMLCAGGYSISFDEFEKATL